VSDGSARADRNRTRMITGGDVGGDHAQVVRNHTRMITGGVGRTEAAGPEEAPGPAAVTNGSVDPGHLTVPR
jgi:hypothetical protein